MHAAVVELFGQPPRYRSFPDPAANEDEVLVEVRAAGLHPIVRGRASGTHYSADHKLPAVPGIDGVGVLADGKRVYFALVREPWGTMGELAAAPRSMCIPIPDGLDDAHAAAIANPGMSAWVSLTDRAGLVAGETVLIMGATGVAGHLAIQVARHLGAKRIIAAGRNVESIASSDVDAIVALGQQEDAIREALIAEAAFGIDVVVDYLWGRPTELVLDALASGYRAKSTHRTRLVEVGSSAGKTITLAGDILRSIDLTVLGSGFGAASIDRILAGIPQLFALAATGKLSIEVEASPLSDVEAAWSRGEKAQRTVFTP